MKGVLVVAHGSRAKETEAVLESILYITKKKLPHICIEHAFMEFSEKTIEAGITALANKKVTDIKVVPYFLFAGVHSQKNIPDIVSRCMKNYPEIKVLIGEPIGLDKRMADILAGCIIS